MMGERTILLADDSKTSQLTTEMMLKKYPCRILKATDGEQAVAVAVTERPDLILLDVVMPRMNGFQVLAALRAREETREIPVIMVTTRGEAGNVETGFRQGCNDYVIKPFSSVELLEKIRNLIG